MPRDDRRMTFIVVPHGGKDLSTRSFEISYRRLRVAATLLVVAAVFFLFVTISWFWMAAQAARVPVLQREITHLEGERQRVEQLARVIARMEAQYQQVRVMLGGPEADSVRAAASAAAAAAADTVPVDTTATDADAVAEGDPQAMLPRAWPLEERGYVTRGVLPRLGHSGIDIAVRGGSRVLASGGGTVLAAGEDSVYGRFVRIAHDDGYESTYGHVSRVLVAEQERVHRRQVIALSGNTGRSTAPHLHFEIRKDGSPVDPGALVRNPR